MSWYSCESISGGRVMMCGRCYVAYFTGNKQRTSRVLDAYGVKCCECNYGEENNEW
jgi:hypothetical protein